MQRGAVATKPTAAAHRTRPPVLVVLLVVTLIAYLTAITVTDADGGVLELGVGVLATLPFVLAGVLAWQRAGSSKVMSGWRWLSASLFAYALGHIVWYALDLIDTLPNPPAPQDLFHLAFPVLGFVGMLKLAHGRLRRPRERGWLDALVVGSGAFTVGAECIAAQLDDVPTFTPGLLVTGAYLLGDLVLLALAIAVAQGFGWRAPIAWWLLITGFVVFALSDGLYAITTANGTYTGGTVADAGWAVGATAIGLAAWLDRPTTRIAAAGAWSTRVGPSIAILAAAAVLLLGDISGAHWLARGAALVTIVLGVVRMALSVSDADDFAEQLRRAELDPLTGLVNQRGLQSLRPDSSPGVLLALDLDGFADVNHSLGREAGDLVLVEVAQRMRMHVRASDVVARTGGDDFCIVLMATEVNEAMRIAEALVRFLERPISVHGTTVNVSACVGVAPVDGGTSSLGGALRDAGEALDRARDQGVGVVQQFAGSTGERSLERLQLRADLRAALSEGTSFLLHYQPIVDVRDGEVFAVEALVRWQREDRLLAPGDFLPEIAHIGAMGELTTIVLSQALGELRTAGLSFPVTVNVPPDVIDERLVGRVLDALAASATQPEQLLIEILEDALFRDPDHSRGVLGTLRSHGVRVLLDDFGTGWAGFGTLRDLSVDGLKIDASFVSAMHDDAASASIVGAVAGVARDLGLLVVYEGVEAPMTIKTLRALPQAYGQGFGLARPMPISDLANWAALRGANAASIS